MYHYPTRQGGQKVYYVCNGKHQGRAIFGTGHPACPSKAIPGDIEDVVWKDLAGFLRDPGPVLRLLRDRTKDLGRESSKAQNEATALGAALQSKDSERNAVLALFRRGRIDAATLDQQLDEVERERGQLGALIRELEDRRGQSAAAEARIRSVEDLLIRLSHCLGEPLTWEVKREVVESLVDSIRVETIPGDGTKEISAVVTYCFSTPFTSTANRTPAGAAPAPNPASRSSR